jgi:ribosomal protein S18 acetylase RimI-like enzyme
MALVSLGFPAVRVRKARQDDAAVAARLLFESAPDMYMRFSGGRERAIATLERAFGEPGNLASADVTWLAEVDGRPAAVMAGFPVAQAALRSRAYLGFTLRGTPFWRWPGVLRLYWLGGRATPAPRNDSFYIDALATDPEFRRRGAARALLDEAERQARAHGLPAVSLDTTMDNDGARALYASAGYDEVVYRPPSRRLPGFVGLVKQLGR